MKLLTQSKSAIVQVSKKNTDTINQNNFEELVCKENEILPDLKDGEQKHLRGKITSLKSTRRDTINFQYVDDGNDYNLDLFPPKGKTTKNYTDFYQEFVDVTVDISRGSLYRKPKLHLIEIFLVEPKLNFDEDSKDD